MSKRAGGDGDMTGGPAPPGGERRRSPRSAMVFTSRERLIITEVIDNVCFRMGVVDIEQHAEDHRALAQYRSTVSEMIPWFRAMKAKDEAMTVRVIARTAFWTKMRDKLVEGVVGKAAPFVVWLPIVVILLILKKQDLLGEVLHALIGGK